MNCKRCGFLLAQDDKFCKNCGTPVESQNGFVENLNEGISDIHNPENIQSQVINESVSSQNNNLNNLSSQTTVGEPTINNSQLNSNIQMNNNSQSGIQQNAGFSQINQDFQNQKMGFSIGKNMKLIIIGVAFALVLLISAIILIPKFVIDNSSSDGVSDNIIKNTPAYKVNFANFTFSIPGNFIYKVQNEYVVLSNEEDTWVAYLEVMDANYDKIKTKKSNLSSSFQKNGQTVKSIDVKSLRGVEYIIIDASASGYNITSAVAKLNSMKSVVISVLHKENVFSSNYDVLKELSSVVSTAVYNNTSDSISDSSIISGFNSIESVAK